MADTRVFRLEHVLCPVGFTGHGPYTNDLPTPCPDVPQTEWDTIFSDRWFAYLGIPFGGRGAGTVSLDYDRSVTCHGVTLDEAPKWWDDARAYRDFMRNGTAKADAHHWAFVAYDVPPDALTITLGQVLFVREKSIRVGTVPWSEVPAPKHVRAGAK